MYSASKWPSLSIVDNPLIDNPYIQKKSKNGTPPIPPSSDIMITEDGKYMITENNDYMITE